MESRRHAHEYLKLAKTFHVLVTFASPEENLLVLLLSGLCEFLCSLWLKSFACSTQVCAGVPVA
jgi:hypothetical protein